MPASANTALAQSWPALGLTVSRPANIVGSLRIAVPWIHAGGPGEAAAADSLATTRAHAPSDDGHVSRYRMGSQSIIDSATFSNVVSASWRCAYGFFKAFSRSLT